MTDYYQNKIRKYLNGLIPAIILIWGWTPVCAQHPLKGRELLQYNLNKKHLEYVCPEGWAENFEDESFDPANNYLISSTSYRIEPPEKDAMIVFCFPPFMSVEDSIKVAPLSRIFHHGKEMPARNEQYLTNVKNKADTLEGKKITFYPSKYARKVFRADHAGTYHLWQTNTYRNKFDRCKVVYLFKNDVGLVELYYYYNSDTKDIDKYIKKTAGMIRFKKE